MKHAPIARQQKAGHLRKIPGVAQEAPYHRPARLTIFCDVAQHQNTTVGQLIAMLKHYDEDAPVLTMDFHGRFVPAMVHSWDEKRKNLPQN